MPPALFPSHRPSPSRDRSIPRILACSLWSGLVLGLVFSVLSCAPEARGPGADPDATIRIDPTERLNPISDLLYGQFAEFMFENIKFGLWAELLANRGFEDLAPPPAAAHYWERYPDTRNHANGFSLGGATSGISEQGYPPSRPNRAQVLINRLSEQQGHGIYQARIPVRKGLTYRGSLWLRGAGPPAPDGSGAIGGTFSGKVAVSLEEDRSDGSVYSSWEVSEVPKDWTQVRFELPVQASDAHARFAIRLFGVGTVWVDQVSLLPSDATDSIRADVLELVQALQPAFVRWPGGNVAQDYHWEWGIGPRDQRPTWVNMSWDNDPEPADFGTIEFLEFCRRLGAEPNIVVNLEGRGATVVETAALRAEGKDIRLHARPATAEEAANWVEYVNGPPDSIYGSLRGRDGYREPFGVRYWEIGNEIWGGWVRGHSDAATYASNARRYIRAMKAVDPSVRIIAVGDEDMDWNRTVLQELGDEIDLLAIHHYRPKADDAQDFQSLMARPLWYERFYDRVREAIREHAPGRDIGVALNEWNTTFGIPRQHTMESALYGARLMNVFERQGDLIRMSAVSDLVNGWPGGVIQASRHDIFTTATYSVIRAYNEHHGAWRVAAAVACDVSYSPGNARLGPSVPALDVVASTDLEGTEVYVKAVNTSPTQPISARVELVGGEVDSARRGHVTTITASSLQEANTFSSPNRIITFESSPTFRGSTLTHEFPEHSVTVIRLPLDHR